MKGKHLDIETIYRYVSGKLSPSQETDFQEHISECDECRKKLSGFRSLSTELSENNQENKVRIVFRRIYHSPYVRVAALLIIVAGIGFAIYNSTPKGVPVNNGLNPENVFSIDSMPKKAEPADTINNDTDSLSLIPDSCCR